MFKFSTLFSYNKVQPSFHIFENIFRCLLIYSLNCLMCFRLEFSDRPSIFSVYFFFDETHKNKSQVDRSREREGHSIRLPFPIYLFRSFLYKYCLTSKELCRKAPPCSKIMSSGFSCSFGNKSSVAFFCTYCQ